jgi:hypothetical protein
MYDAVPGLAGNIPANAQLVAGYIDSVHYTWSAANWARFPAAVKVQISTTGTNAGQVCDCETGDLTAAQAVSWVKTRRASGADPTVYCSASSWPGVQAAFSSAGVAQPHYWIAHYDGVQSLPTLNGITAVAKQYADPGPYDLSIVADSWPGVDSQEVPEVELSDRMTNYQGQPATDKNGNAVSVGQTLWGNNDAGWQSVALLAALTKALAALATTVGSIAAQVGAEKTDLDNAVATLTAVQTAIAALPTSALSGSFTISGTGEVK